MSFLALIAIMSGTAEWPFGLVRRFAPRNDGGFATIC